MFLSFVSRSAFALTAIGLLSVSATASAQQAPALGGAPVNGVCLLSREAVFANAAVGKAADARLAQIVSEAQGQINAEQKPLDDELAALRADAKLSPAQRAERERTLAARLQPVQLKAQRYSREIEATRAKVLGRISTEAQPVIAEVYQRQKCGLLIDRASVLGGNMANDLTPMVVKSLDARITTLTFDREQLPAAAAAAPASN